MVAPARAAGASLRAAGFAAFGVCVIAGVVFLGSTSGARTAALMQRQLQQGPLIQPAQGPMRKGALLSMDVPASQLASTKVLYFISFLVVASYVCGCLRDAYVRIYC